MARHLGADELDADFVGRDVHARAVETFHRLEPRTRDVYRGFAEGVNHYVRLHADEFPPWVRPHFTGIDALARDVQTWSRSDAARFVARLARREAERDIEGAGPGNGESGRDAITLEGPSSTFALDGSNAWAFHGTRTESGNTILLRNPHLRWDGDHDLLARPSGLTYYEAHVRVPGVIDFYGDFRIGTAFGIIGGFNARLGWATTNNYPTLSQVYKLGTHPALNDHALLDGRALPLERRDATRRLPDRHCGHGHGNEDHLAHTVRTCHSPDRRACVCAEGRQGRRVPSRRAVPAHDDGRGPRQLA